MITETTRTWFPLFEFREWTYQSFLLLPTPEQDASAPGAEVTARKWANGEFLCGQAFGNGDGFTLSGTLAFRPGVTLAVAAKGMGGSGDAAGTFEATGTGLEGPLKGMVSRLVGWVFPQLPIQNGAARVACVRGSIWAVRGPDTRPDIDPSGMPLGTVGAFVIGCTS